MSNFLQADLPSEDEADEDFNPDLGNEVPLPRDSQDERDGSLAAGAGRQETTHAKAARKERVDALWEQLQAKTSVKAKRPRIEPALDRPTLAQESSGGDSSTVAPPAPSSSQQQEQPCDAAASKAARARKAAAAALAAARAAAAASAGAQYGMPRVAETRNFAGQQVTVTRAAQPAEAAAGAQKPVTQAAGLDVALASLAEPKKINVLDKTRSDWSEFKADNDSVDAELEAHKRSSAQYLDKQAFLQAAELREYEAERDKRLRGR